MGTQAIAALKVGDHVTAYDPATGKSSTQTVEATSIHHDNNLLDVTLQMTDSTPSTTSTTSTTPTTSSTSSSSTGSSHTAQVVRAVKAAKPTTHTEVVHTTANHPWLSADHGWLIASFLHVGEPVRQADGSTATVVAIRSVPGAADMWDLTVSQVHDFAVGNGAFVVHNCGGGIDESYDVWKRITPLADDLPGTKVPGRFMLQSGSKSFEVVENGTKHMGEYLTRQGTAGVNAYRRATYMLDSFSRAVDEAGSLVKDGERWFGKAGGWELGIDGADNHIFHARPMW